MAQDVLNGILASHMDNGYPIPEPAYKGGHPVEVSPKVVFAIGLRKARASPRIDAQPHEQTALNVRKLFLVKV